MLKKWAREVRQSFIRSDLHDLAHFRELLLHLEDINTLENSQALAEQIHERKMTQYYEHTGAPPSPKLHKMSMTIDFSVAATSLFPRRGSPKNANANPMFRLEENQQLLLNLFGDRFFFYGNRYLQAQGSCAHLLNIINLEKRFEVLFGYPLNFSQSLPQNLGLCFLDPLVEKNILQVFFPEGTIIPTRNAGRPFSTKSEVFVLKVLEGGAFLSRNARTVAQFEVKLMDVIDPEDGFLVKMQLGEGSVLTLTISNRANKILELRSLYRVRPLSIYQFPNLPKHEISLLNKEIRIREDLSVQDPKREFCTGQPRQYKETQTEPTTGTTPDRGFRRILFGNGRF